MAQVMDAHVVEPGPSTDAAPGLLDIGEMCAGVLPDDDPGVVVLTGCRPLPDHLPREETHLAPGERCADCGGRKKRLG